MHAIADVQDTPDSVENTAPVGFGVGGRVQVVPSQTSPSVIGLRVVNVAKSGGGLDVRVWHGGPRPGPGVLFARQNLPPIVEHGRANPRLSDGPEWGYGGSGL